MVNRAILVIQIWAGFSKSKISTKKTFFINKRRPFNSNYIDGNVFIFSTVFLARWLLKIEYCFLDECACVDRLETLLAF